MRILLYTPEFTIIFKVFYGHRHNIQFKTLKPEFLSGFFCPIGFN